MEDFLNSQGNKLELLRKKYPKFVFESYSYSIDDTSLEATFKFIIEPDLVFSPQVKVTVPKDILKVKEKSPVVDNFVFHLGLSEIASYWKTTCAPLIEIKAGFLDQEQINWWKELLLNGMGEFFYKNKIDFTQSDFLKIEVTGKQNLPKDQNKHLENYLILNGGGRDTAVSFETLKELNKNCALLTLNPTIATKSMAQVSTFQHGIVIERKIDENLIKLNQAGYLNGHTPFSSYLSFLATLCAYLVGYKYAVASNERSSNEENVEYLGQKINHQYSKSFNYETAFRKYSSNYLSEEIEYFSLVRPLYELQISKVFSTYPQYFEAFKSCNVGQKTNSWCGKCPKCLSIFISLFPFIENEKIFKIFGSNLYEDQTLLDLLQHLTGEKSPKPFECVGTYDEVLASLVLSIKKLEGENLPYLLNYAQENLNLNQRKADELLQKWDDQNYLQTDIEQLLKNKINDNR